MAWAISCWSLTTGRDLNLGPPEYEQGALTIRP
jgi:hypothetical protein